MAFQRPLPSGISPPPQHSPPKIEIEDYYLNYIYPDPDYDLESEYRKSDALFRSSAAFYTIADIDMRIGRNCTTEENSLRRAPFLEPVQTPEDVQENYGYDGMFQLYAEESDQKPAAIAQYSLFKLRKKSDTLTGTISSLSKLLSNLETTEDEEADRARLRVLVTDIASFQCLLFSAYNLKVITGNEEVPGPPLANPHFRAIGNIMKKNRDKDNTLNMKDVTRYLNHARLYGQSSPDTSGDGKAPYANETAAVYGPYKNAWDWFRSRIVGLMNLAKAEIDKEKATQAKEG